MEYTKLGNSDLNISRICLGCMGFGDSSNGQHSWTLNYNDSAEIIKKAFKGGINFFDTALVYQNGTSEQYVGKILKEIAKRDEYVLATKFVPRTKEEIDNNVSITEHINNSINQSLKNLELDYVDLYIYHMWDYNSKMEEIMEALNNLVKEGKTRYLGISNCFAWQLADANNYAQNNNLSQFISVQGHYNLINREEEREMIPYCRMKNIALTPYSSLAGGRLAKRPDEQSKRQTEDDYARHKYQATEEMDNIIRDRVYELSQKYDCSMTEISLNWLLSKVTAPVVGATKTSQIDGMLNAFKVNLSPEDLFYLQEAYVPHDIVGVLADNNPFRE